MSGEGMGENQRLEFRANVDDIVLAGSENPIRVVVDSASNEPSPYLLVREGIEALISRAVFYDLVDLAVEKPSEDGTVLGVWSNGVWFSLGFAD